MGERRGHNATDSIRRIAQICARRAAPVKGFRVIAVPAFSTALWLAVTPVGSTLTQPPVEPSVATPAQVPPVVTPLPPVGPRAPEPEAPPPQSGEIVVTGRSRAGDPLQGANVVSFDAAQGVDRAVVGPAAKAYKKNVPKPLRSGLRNFLNNLREPVVFVNYLLQLKVGKAGETAGRFVLNSTVGVAGLVDVAKRKPFYLPRRRNGFANTLGFYGVKPGPFFFVPLIGPTTLRDLIGNFADQFVPIGPIQPLRGKAYTIPVGVLSALDYRAELDEELERQRATIDPYSAARSYYLKRRQAEIDALRGRHKVKVTPPVEPMPVPPPVSMVEPVDPAMSPPQP